jgi:hypothetical protein
MSDGIFDNRGVESQLALKDVLLFAGGRLADIHGRKISQLIPVKISGTDIGIIGWSNGGNIALVTMAKYAANLSWLRWAAFYECPIGSMFNPPNLGSVNDLLLNRHYRQGSAATGKCILDFKNLAWEADTKRNFGEHKTRGEPEIPGVLYYDENRNGKWDESIEYAFNYAMDLGLSKQIYPPDVIRGILQKELFVQWVQPDSEAEKPQTGILKFFGGDGKKAKPKAPLVKKLNWPNNVATLEESEAYFKERDGSLYMPEVRRKYPNLLITIFGSEIDHFRLNPEAVYVSQLADINFRNFVNNKPNTSIDSSVIEEALEPEGLIPDFLYMDSTVAELADRTRLKKLDSPLAEVLVNYTTGKENATTAATKSKDAKTKPPDKN